MVQKPSHTSMAVSAVRLNLPLLIVATARAREAIKCSTLELRVGLRRERSGCLTLGHNIIRSRTAYPHQIDGPDQILLHKNQLVVSLLPVSSFLSEALLDTALPFFFDSFCHHLIGHLAHKLLVDHLLSLLSAAT